MKTSHRLGGCSVVAFALLAGVCSFPGCDSGPKEGSAPPLSTGTGKAGKDAVLNEMVTGKKGSSAAETSGKDKVITPGSAPAPK
jgi:hypothetical protein